MKLVNSSKAPAAVGPYSHAVEANGFLFISGQLPMKDGALIEDVKKATEQCITNAKYILEEAGMSLENVVKTTVLLSDINLFKDMNEVYAKFFTDHKPARAAYEVANLPLGAVVEIEFIACKG